MPRGGRRSGTQGKPYANRSDLAINALSVPVQAPTGLPYGEHKALIDQQQGAPMVAPTPPAPAVSPAAPPPALPGAAGSFFRPTDRPNEPVTAGLPFGPGPGPEALGPLGQPSTAADLLSRLAQVPGSSPDVAFLASYAAGGRS